MQNAPTEPCRLQVTPSCPLVAPLFLFPGVHLSFTAVVCYILHLLTLLPHRRTRSIPSLRHTNLDLPPSTPRHPYHATNKLTTTITDVPQWIADYCAAPPCWAPDSALAPYFLPYVSSNFVKYAPSHTLCMKIFYRCYHKLCPLIHNLFKIRSYTFSPW